MSSSRAQVAMSHNEVQALLAEGQKLQVATVEPDGGPHLTTLFYGVDDGLVVFWTYGKSRKAVNLRRDPRIAVLVEEGEEYNELRGVSIQGRAEVQDDPDLVRAFGMALYERNTGPVDEHARRLIDSQVAKRIVVRVHPTATASWDHRKMG